DSISLRTPEGILTFYGRELEMNTFTADGATVMGRLQRIEFTEDEACC
ncbi:MAG: YabP/YqfC family sporulation protein, partial [Clostridia bacterium]|nr:YabP/YqfC family sporulation protein [Clostridia bacterium]